MDSINITRITIHIVLYDILALLSVTFKALETNKNIAIKPKYATNHIIRKTIKQNSLSIFDLMILNKKIQI